jgi:hypothetical protein
MCKKKKDEVIKMEITYCVEAKCNKTSGMNVEFKGVGNLESAMSCATTLELAFPDVTVICEQTGEIMYHRLMSFEVFNPIMEMGKAIFKAEFDMYV